MPAKRKSKKKIGQPISVTVTPEQRHWLNTQIPMGGTMTQVIRAIIEEAMKVQLYSDKATKENISTLKGILRGGSALLLLVMVSAACGRKEAPAAHVDYEVTQIAVKSQIALAGSKTTVELDTTTTQPLGGLQQVLIVLNQGAEPPENCQDAAEESNNGGHTLFSLEPGTAYAARACMFDAEFGVYSKGKTKVFTTDEAESEEAAAAKREASDEEYRRTHGFYE